MVQRTPFTYMRIAHEISVSFCILRVNFPIYWNFGLNVNKLPNAIHRMNINNGFFYACVNLLKSFPPFGLWYVSNKEEHSGYELLMTLFFFTVGYISSMIKLGLPHGIIVIFSIRTFKFVKFSNNNRQLIATQSWNKQGEKEKFSFTERSPLWLGALTLGEK